MSIALGTQEKVRIHLSKGRRARLEPGHDGEAF